MFESVSNFAHSHNIFFLFSQYIISKMAWQWGVESNLCPLIWVHFYLLSPKADLNLYFIQNSS